jgi:hypothetical protein
MYTQVMTLNDVGFIAHFLRAQTKGFRPRDDDIAHSTTGLLIATAEGLAWLAVAMLSLRQAKSFTATTGTHKMYKRS